MKGFFYKTPFGTLAPADEETANRIQKLRVGNPVRVEFASPRNYQFHKKFFALLDFAYDYWEPSSEIGESKKWGIPEKNKESFRNDVTILAGYYDTHYKLDGSVRVTAKSISFASMNQDEFEKLYSAAIDVILKKILINFTEDELHNAVNQLLGFM